VRRGRSRRACPTKTEALFLAPVDDSCENACTKQLHDRITELKDEVTELREERKREVEARRRADDKERQEREAAIEALKDRKSVV